MNSTNFIIAALLGISAFGVRADATTAQQLADKYAAAAKIADPTYAGLSAAEGKAFFTRKVVQFKGDPSNPGKEIACASCHTANPADPGKHIVSGKPIAPLSPAVNPERFESMDDVEKYFNKHCNEVVGSDCTAKEKGNYIAYLLTEKTPTKK